MRIAYLANIRLPTERAHGLQIMESCRAFAQEGHQVRLIVPRRRNAIAATPWEHYGMPKDFEIVGVPIFDFIPFDRFLGRAALWLNALQFSAAAKKAARAFAPEVVYARDPWYAGVVPEARYVYEAHDFPKRVTALHRRAWEGAARIVTVTSGLKRAFLDADVEDAKLVAAHDGVDAAKFDVRETKAEARAKLGLPAEGFIAAYTGHLYPYKGADDLLEACVRLRPASRVVFVGGRPDDLARLTARAAELGAANALFVGQVPHAQVPLYLRAADAAVLPTRAADRHASEFLSPLKLFEYLAAGKAVVATETPSVREVLDDTSAVFVPPSDPAALAAALNDLADVPVKVETLSRASARLAKEHAWTRRAARVLEGLPERAPVAAWFRRYRTELRIAALAFAVRAAYALFFPHPPFGGDEGLYLELADVIRGAAEHRPNALTFYPLMYPSLLAAVRTLFGEDLVWIRLAQSAIGAGTVFLMAAMGRRWIGPRAGAALGLLAALYPSMVLETSIIYTETTYAFFLTAAAAAGALAVETRRLRVALAAGIAFALAGMTRELAFYQAAIFAAWAALSRRSARLALLILAPTLLVMWGISVRNAAIADRLAIDSVPLVSKRYEQVVTEPNFFRNMLWPDRWHLYLEGTYLYFRFPARLSDLGTGEPIADPNPSGEVVYHLDLKRPFAPQPPTQVAAKIFLVLFHWLILALAAYGFWRAPVSRRAKTAAAIVVLFGYAAILVHGVHSERAFRYTEPQSRYRFPTEPLIMLMAVAGAQALDARRKRR